MRRFTTPTLAVTIGGADLTGCDAWLTLRQGDASLTLRLDGSDGWSVGEGSATKRAVCSCVSVTEPVADRDVEVQANVIDANGYRWATEVATCRFGRNLLEVVREHG